MFWLLGNRLLLKYPASKVDSVVVRASMESAGPSRQSVQAAGKLPEELSASDGLGCARLAMWVNQSRRKRRGWKQNSFWVMAVRWVSATQAGIKKLSRLIFLLSRWGSPNGTLSLSVAYQMRLRARRPRRWHRSGCGARIALAAGELRCPGDSTTEPSGGPSRRLP